MILFQLKKSAVFPALVLTGLCLLSTTAGSEASSPDLLPPSLERMDAAWKGDLQQMLEQRRFIRVLVSYSSTYFFIDRGTPRGMEYELLERYEAFLNQRRPKGSLKIHMVYVAVPFEALLPALLDGRGDIAASGLTVTAARKQKVAFTRPYIKDIQEVVVTSNRVKGLKSVEGLAGRRVTVVAGSSYVGHLRRLNAKLAEQGRKPLQIDEAPRDLEAEDILQMVNAGIFDLTVVDSHVADLWSGVLGNIAVRKDLTVNRGGEIAWAVRPDSPQLLDSLNAFLKHHGQGTLVGNVLLKRYFENTRWISNPLDKAERDRLLVLRSLFQKYSKKYGFDWLKIAALAYQESRLDQNAKSARGAVGIMQILPSTAAGKAVNIADVTTPENNIHAGVKYLALLRDTYFNDPVISSEARVDFTFAAYNAGPTKVNRLRKQAARAGLDPNRWEGSVEHVARKVIGRETVQFVANIHMYYVAYFTSMTLIEQRREQIKKQP
jgi:membrane-bound lytic murein transglycosylase MltF